MFHDTRRYSPSVIDCRPAASCFAITSATSRSSIALKVSASISLRACCSRAALRAGVRRRLPTWSARKGGVERWVIFSYVMAGHSRSKNGVASLAYVPVIPVILASFCQPKRDHRDTTPTRRPSDDDRDGVTIPTPPQLSRRSCAGLPNVRPQRGYTLPRSRRNRIAATSIIDRAQHILSPTRCAV